MSNTINSNSASKITDWVDPKDRTGEFHRKDTTFREWVSPSSDAQFPAEKGRYRLYVSYACPWAHRTLIMRKLKGLEDVISFTAVHWHMGDRGWRFATNDDGNVPGENVSPDPEHRDFSHLRQLYFESQEDYRGRFTVPALYDTKTRQIVNNESADIIRMLNTVFNGLLPDDKAKVNLVPDDLKKRIEEENAWIYDDINNGVYKSGFATTQEAYERNVTKLFQSLDKVEKALRQSGGPYYFGIRLTETDVRLYTTIVRFDPVYVQHFKCNMRDIRSGYPAIHKWLRHLYWDIEAFRKTTEFEHIKKHYTKSHAQINPYAITPLGPDPSILKKDEEVKAVKEL